MTRKTDKRLTGPQLAALKSSGEELVGRYPSTWLHVRTGKRYVVRGIILSADGDTPAPLVHYCAAGRPLHPVSWVRDLDDFLSKFRKAFDGGPR